VAYGLDGKLVVGITSRALFDLDEADLIFREQGMGAYRAFQRSNEEVPIAPGTAFRLVRGLLNINTAGHGHLVEVVVISRNDADSGMRIFNSIRHHKLDITRGAFTDGGNASGYLSALHCSLFLSADPADVAAALLLGVPAALVCTPPASTDDEIPSVVRVAFDGDAVLFDGGSERVFQEQGLEAFQERELRLANQPMNPGPFEPFLRALQHIQEQFPEGATPIRIALVTARSTPAHARVVNTLRSWGIRIDETFFLGGIAKGRVLEVLQPDIYFDDQMQHLESAMRHTPSAHVIPTGTQVPEPLNGTGDADDEPGSGTV